MGLRQLREAAGLSLHGLAKISGVNYMKIHQIETGKINPENVTLRNAQKLASALGCEPRDLLTPDEIPAEAPTDESPVAKEETE